MSESKEYVSQTLEHGAIHISEEVIATIAALAIQDVEGVYVLNTSIASSDLSKLAKRAQGAGIKPLRHQLLEPLAEPFAGA